MTIRTIALSIVIFAVLLAYGIQATPANDAGRAARLRQTDDTEVIDGQEFRHFYTEAAGYRWHSVELGEGEPILFLHGIPGSWYSWYAVMSELSDSYRTIAVDLKGLGLTDRPTEGSYNADTVASELMALMDALEIDQFALVGHEWGSMIASYAAGHYPERVTHFVRIEAPLSDAALSQVQTMLSIPQIAGMVLSNGTGFVRRMYTGESSNLLMGNVPGPVVVQPIAEADVARISQEFSYPGTADSILRYYRETPSDYRSTVTALAAMTTMPVLLVQGDSDPIQPLEFYEDAAAPFPNATLIVLANSGHVPMLEQPQALAEAIRGFLSGSPE